MKYKDIKLNEMEKLGSSGIKWNEKEWTEMKWNRMK